MNAGSGAACDYPISRWHWNLCQRQRTSSDASTSQSRRATANVIYAQVQSIAWNNDAGCGNTNGCQLGVWASTDGGDNWAFIGRIAGGSLSKLP